MNSKTLILYYSLTGNTKFIAETIKDETGADVQPLKPIKDLNPESGTRFMWGGMHATMKKKPELEPFKYDPNDYELLIIGTPIWAWQASPPIRSLVDSYDFTNKKVALWCCCAGKGIKAMERYKKLFKEAKIIDEIILQNPLTTGKEEAREKVIKWIRNLENK
jgi:flavodoxin